MRWLILGLSITLASSASSTSARPVFAHIAPPVLTIRAMHGIIDSDGAIAGVAFGPPLKASAFPRFSIAGLRSNDRLVCVTIHDAANLYEWSFQWRPPIGATQATFELKSGRARPAGARVIDAAIIARVSPNNHCGDADDWLSAWWTDTPNLSSGLILVDGQGATAVWIQNGASRTPCQPLASPSDSQNWLTYGYACAAPPIPCSQARGLSVIRAQGEAFAEPLDLRLRAAC